MKRAIILQVNEKNNNINFKKGDQLTIVESIAIEKIVSTMF